MRSSTCIAGILIFSLSAHAQETARTAPPLDLRPPRIEELYSPAQIAALVGRTADGDLEEVEVYGLRPGEAAPPRSPAVPSGLRSLVWAALNPTQMWRVFAPLPADRADLLGKDLDVALPYRQPATVRPRKPSDPP